MKPFYCLNGLIELVSQYQIPLKFTTASDIQYGEHTFPKTTLSSQNFSVQQVLFGQHVIPVTKRRVRSPHCRKNHRYFSCKWNCKHGRTKQNYINKEHSAPRRKAYLSIYINKINSGGSLLKGMSPLVVSGVSLKNRI